MDYAGRRIRLRQRMAAKGIDLVAVAPGANMLYLLGWHPHPDERPCYLLFTERDEALLMPQLNAAQAREHVDLPMEVYTDAEGPDQALRRLASRLGFTGARRILVDETMRADFALLLQEHVPAARPGVTTELLGGMRMRKDPAEIEALRANARMADAAMEEAFRALRPGMTELELAKVVEDAFARRGADRVTFNIIGGGPNAAFPHHHTGRRPLRAGEAVLLDIGASAQHYNSDITRTAFLGEPDPEYRQVHAVVEAAVQAALAAIRPGVPAREVDEAARRVIRDAGYGEYFTHRVGHGIGLTGHEPPYITGSNDLPLEQGMTFSVEPGIYLPGKFGVRLEEIVVVTDRGAEVLSGLSREVFVARAT